MVEEDVLEGEEAGLVFGVLGRALCEELVGAVGQDLEPEVVPFEVLVVAVVLKGNAVDWPYR